MFQTWSGWIKNPMPRVDLDFNLDFGLGLESRRCWDSDVVISIYKYKFALSCLNEISKLDVNLQALSTSALL